MREVLAEGLWWLIVGIVTGYLREVGFGAVRSFGACVRLCGSCRERRECSAEEGRGGDAAGGYLDYFLEGEMGALGGLEQKM